MYEEVGIRFSFLRVVNEVSLKLSLYITLDEQDLFLFARTLKLDLIQLSTLEEHIYEVLAHCFLLPANMHNVWVIFEMINPGVSLGIEEWEYIPMCNQYQVTVIFDLLVMWVSKLDSQLGCTILKANLRFQDCRDHIYLRDKPSQIYSVKVYIHILKSTYITIINDDI